MTQSLATGGDPLEREYGAFLSTRLPSYEKIWSKFVGNDGRSEMPAVSGLTRDQEIKRHTVNQLTYSAAESAIAATRCADMLETVAQRFSENSSLSADDYLDLSMQLMAFFSYMGRMRDLLEKLGATIGVPSLAEKLDEFYKQRNNAIHEARIPLILTQGSIGVVPPEGVDDDVRRWRKNQLWANKHDLVTVDLVPLVRETLDEALKRLEAALATAFSKLITSDLAMIPAQLAAAPAPVGLASAPSGSLLF